MNKSYSRIILFVLIVTIISSCANRKSLVYFQPDATELNNSAGLNTIRLKPGDILNISVNADDVRATQPFNQMNVYSATGAIQQTNPFLPNYTLDAEGFINFPKLGLVKLSGMTRIEAIDYLRGEISKFILDPGVNINIRNFRVTVLGEVRNPGSYLIDNDRITIMEALGLAGDLTINGVRNNVLVIREENGNKQEYRVDLTKREVLNSPVYYLSQNDVIYIEPNGARVQSSKYTQNNSLFISIAGIVITIISVLVR